MTQAQLRQQEAWGSLAGPAGVGLIAWQLTDTPSCLQTCVCAGILQGLLWEKCCSKHRSSSLKTAGQRVQTSVGGGVAGWRSAATEHYS
jgi:hypothetical protein